MARSRASLLEICHVPNPASFLAAGLLRVALLRRPASPPPPTWWSEADQYRRCHLGPHFILRDDKLVLDARDDAARFVASRGDLRGAISRRRCSTFAASSRNCRPAICSWPRRYSPFDEPGSGRCRNLRMQPGTGSGAGVSLALAPFFPATGCPCVRFPSPFCCSAAAPAPPWRSMSPPPPSCVPATSAASSPALLRQQADRRGP